METRRGCFRTRSWPHSTAVHSNPPAGSFRSLAGALAYSGVKLRRLHRLHRLRGIELPVSLFNAASPLVPGKGHADMVWASPLACGGDFLLRLAIGQGKDLIAEGRLGALAASWSCGGSARAPT